MVWVATLLTRAVGCCPLPSCCLNSFRFKYFVLDEIALSAKISMQTITMARKIADARRMKGGAIWWRLKVTGAGGVRTRGEARGQSPGAGHHRPLMEERRPTSDKSNTERENMSDNGEPYSENVSTIKRDI